MPPFVFSLFILSLVVYTCWLMIPCVSLFLCLYLIFLICLGLQFGLAHIVSAQLQILTCLICIKILILKPVFVSNARVKLGWLKFLGREPEKNLVSMNLKFYQALRVWTILSLKIRYEGAEYTHDCYVLLLWINYFQQVVTKWNFGRYLKNLAIVDYAFHLDTYVPCYQMHRY